MGAGLVVCAPGKDPNTPSGRLTLTCRQDDDCPAAMGCGPGYDFNSHSLGGPAAPGTCERRCATDADCLRCDLACGAGGLCAPTFVPFTPCTWDCECQGAGTSGGTCQGGYCVNGLFRQLLGIPCGVPPGSDPPACVCQGGTCDERGCCMLPDRSIADPFGSVCRP